MEQAEQAKKAAIDIDEIGNKSLNEVSAADFLAALNAGGIQLRQLTVWPEKKKIETWSEPEDLPRIRVNDFIEWMRGEKKKVELEKQPGEYQPPPGKYPGFESEKKKVELEKQPGFESWRDPREQLYDELLTRLTRDIEARFRFSR